MIDDRSTHNNLPVPNAANKLDEEVTRLIELVGSLDTKIHDLEQTINSRALSTDLSLYQALAGKNVANGFAGLDASGVIPIDVLPPSISSGLKFQGTYNASNGTPAFPTPAAGNNGFFWIVSVAGGIYSVGDWAVSNGSAIVRVPSFNTVISVNSKTGPIVLTSADITDSNRVRFISEVQATGSEVNLTFSSLSGHANLRFELENIFMNAPNAKVRMTVSTDNVTFLTTTVFDYISNFGYFLANPTTYGVEEAYGFSTLTIAPGTSGSATGIARTTDGARPGLNGAMTLRDTNTNVDKFLSGFFQMANQTTVAQFSQQSVNGVIHVRAPIQAVRFSASAGTFAAGGKIKLHSLK